MPGPEPAEADRTKPIFNARRLAAIAALALATVLVIRWASRALPVDKYCPDYLCYWAAGSILKDGGSPYDPALQAREQAAIGWDKAEKGLGIYDFMPFYYPPWFAMLCAAFVPLGYPAAKAAWFVLNAEVLLLTAWLLRGSVRGVSSWLPSLVVPVFVFSWASVVLGQTTPLVLLAVVGSWRLLQGGRDRLAGAVLAGLTVKPQLSGLLLAALLVWAARRGRWGVIAGFAATLGAFVAASFLVLPGWVGDFLNAPRVTPPPTDYFPWIGTTWFLLLKGVGLRSIALWGGYLIVALPFLYILFRAAFDRARPLEDALCLGLLAAYVVAPYGRHYDFPVLLIPLFVLMNGRVSQLASAALLVGLLALPYLHYLLLPGIKVRMGITGMFNPEITFAWVPFGLTVAWLATSGRGRARA